MNALMEKHKSRKARKFHPLRRQIAALFIGLLLLSLIAITMINGLFLEKYYIAKKTETLTQTVHAFEELQISSNTDGTWSADISDEIYKKVLKKIFPGRSSPGTARQWRLWEAPTKCWKTG